MQFINNTLINPEVVADNIPIINGTDYYIDEQEFVCTYNQSAVKVINHNGIKVQVTTFDQITENIYIVNDYLAYLLVTGEILVTQIPATKDVYKGGFQGIAGFNEGEASFEFMNNTSQKSTFTFTARLNNLKHLEIQIGDSWYVPNGEFRIWINDVFYNVSGQSTLPNTFGETFTVTLSGWTQVAMSDTTDYIKDLLVQGNTLYLSSRKHIIGSPPYDWTVIDEKTALTVWSEDVRLIGSDLYGDPAYSHFFVVNTDTNQVYYVANDDLSIVNTYEHDYAITGAVDIDKGLLGIVDRRFFTVISFYQSLNNFLQKTILQYEFKQMSAYEELPDYTFFETVGYDRKLNTVAIRSNYRINMLLYIVSNNVSSICHTDSDLLITEEQLYKIVNKQVTRYSTVEANSYYEADDLGLYTNCIYIGTDLEASDGGSTLKDTEIIFEGKLAIDDGFDTICIESSTDVPVAPVDLPVRTNQVNPHNQWYLYSKTLRFPVSYTDWFKITMMPTTKIYAIRLVDTMESSKKKSRK